MEDAAAGAGAAVRISLPRSCRADWDRRAPREEEDAGRPAADDASPRQPGARPGVALCGTGARRRAGSLARSAPANGVAARPRHRQHRERSSSPRAPRRTFPEFDDEPQASERPCRISPPSRRSLSRELEPPYCQNSANAADKWQDGDAPAEESTVAAAIAPGPSRRAAAARAAAQQRSRSRVGMLVAAVILGRGHRRCRRLLSPLDRRGRPLGRRRSSPAEPGEVRVAGVQRKARDRRRESVGDAVYNRVAGTTAPDGRAGGREQRGAARRCARIVLPQSQSNADNSVVRPVGGEDPAAPMEPCPTPHQRPLQLPPRQRRGACEHGGRDRPTPRPDLCREGGRKHSRDGRRAPHRLPLRRLRRIKWPIRRSRSSQSRCRPSRSPKRTRPPMPRPQRRRPLLRQRLRL